jgi:hypothetical protein
MTADPSVPRPYVTGPPNVPARPPRPATVIAVLVVVLVHATFLLGSTVASLISLGALVLTHPDFGLTPSVLVIVGLGILLDLVLAAVAVVLVVRLWHAGRRAQTLLTVWLGLNALVALGNVVGSSIVAGLPSIVLVTLRVVELALCVAALVLLRRPATSAWLRSRSVGPA